MTLAEMKVVPNLFNGVELLTLSACNTAAQLPGANGREIDGFAELAQRKGAGAVMATLWPVADQSTPWLMSEFYRARGVVSNATKAEALRRAQLALLSGTARLGSNSATTMRAKIIGAKATVVGPRFITDPSKPYAHPYYWAPFILIGNWR